MELEDAQSNAKEREDADTQEGTQGFCGSWPGSTPPGNIPGLLWESMRPPLSFARHLGR